MTTPVGPIVYVTVHPVADPGPDGLQTPKPALAVSGIVVLPDDTLGSAPSGAVEVGDLFPMVYGQTLEDLSAAILERLSDAYGVTVPPGTKVVYVPHGLA